ncbi:MFS transporter [Brevibacillus marinus]|uniref:MFS transporter n=1 Tax=Brevibacillus marinus TaxID=2496837 RepID=UPI0013DF8F15|nr:MFS transporter [Brevibacillus marinus]
MFVRNKWLYMLGTGCSSFGDGLQSVAASWFLLQWTGSPLAIGGMIAVTYLPPLLLAPFAGAFSDSRDAQRMAVTVDLLRFLVVGLMALLFVLDLFAVWWFYLLQFLLAVANMFFKPSSQILVKEAFTDEQLVDVLTKSSSLNLTASLIGSGFGGWMATTFSPSFIFFTNALTFLASGACNANLHRIQRRFIPATKSDFIRGLTAGGNFLMNRTGMLYLLFLSVISSFGLQMTNTLLAPYVDLYLGGSSLSYAILDISFTVGGVLSGLIVGRMLQRYGPNVVIASLLGMGVLSGLAGIRASFLQVALSMFGLGFFVMFHLVTMQTLIQVNTPKEILGSVVGLRSIVASLTKIGAALGTGFALSHFDITYVFWGFTAIIMLTLFTAGKVRTLPIPESLYTPSNTKAAGG